jgi:ribosomal protein S18 acetylase RimI-like enzyme
MLSSPGGWIVQVAGSISASDVGHRVVLRRRVGVTDGRPQYADVLGELLALTDEVAVVRKKDATEVRVPLGEVTRAKRVPPARDRRVGDLALERIAALGWPGTQTAEAGGWLLRAGGGFTGRANSALPTYDDPDPAVVLDWYAARNLPALAQVPVTHPLYAHLEREGWEPGHGAYVLTAHRDDVLAATPARDDLPPVEVAGTPDADWLSLYHHRGGPLPDAAVGVLTAGGRPEFHTLRLGGRVAAVCRTATAEGWLGLTAVEVAPARRRQGLATHLLRSVTERTDARRLYLQTEHANTGALALYRRAGFTVHHEYRYLRAPG